jgi:hypothetical protein
MTTAAVPSGTDLVVVLPGIMGSALGQRTASKRAKENLVWAVTGRAAIKAARNFLGHTPRLALPDGIGDEHPNDNVEPVGLMSDLHRHPRPMDTRPRLRFAAETPESTRLPRILRSAGEPIASGL